MFANILRSQTRIALTSCRTHVPAFPISRLAPRLRSLPTVSPALRSISTSRPVWNTSRPVGDNNENDTLYVGNLPFTITEEEVREKFEPFGAIKDVRLSYHADGRSRGFAHVEFAEIGDAIAAHNSFREEPLYLLDRDVRIDYAGARQRNSSVKPSLTLYFRDFRGTLDDLREVTSEFETSITNMFFLRDRETGENTGAGFIHFISIEQAEEALKKLDGHASGDNILRLRFAAPKRESQDRRRHNSRY